ncbi:hypothetical protein EB796_022685 [Bugula neritina]|uniref:Uncharacterized protein n=1 Tax=Bugula neritina TaxID=10212 RepID=A0A7J7IYM4_BUGNE|nr:hypothetical protein EB796_022685 [Bugula neritina]
MLDALEGLEGVEVYIDDPLVHAPSIEEHGRILEAVLERLVQITQVSEPTQTLSKPVKSPCKLQCEIYKLMRLTTNKLIYQAIKNLMSHCDPISIRRFPVSQRPISNSNSLT